MTIQYVDWPEGVSNLEYMTLREMAAAMGISPMRFRQLLQRAEYKLGLISFVPRMNRIKTTTRRELLAATDDNSVCDLCQRPLGRVPLPPGEVPTWADLMEPRFVEPVSIDHILPVANGGTDEPANLRVVHALCNMRDGARRPLEHYQEAPLGYVRKAETLPNGRGARTWIEVEPGSAELVRFVIGEYAKGATLTSIAERLRKWPRRRLREARAQLLIRRSARTIRDYIVNELLRPHLYSGQPRPGKRTSPYPALIDAAVADQCMERLELRWRRISTRRERLASGPGQAPRAVRTGYSPKK